jgi:hypothetical protein
LGACAAGAALVSPLPVRRSSMPPPRPGCQLAAGIAKSASRRACAVSAARYLRRIVSPGMLVLVLSPAALLLPLPLQLLLSATTAAAEQQHGRLVFGANRSRMSPLLTPRQHVFAVVGALAAAVAQRVRSTIIACGVPAGARRGR